MCRTQRALRCSVCDDLEIVALLPGAKGLRPSGPSIYLGGVSYEGKGVLKRACVDFFLSLDFPPT